MRHKSSNGRLVRLSVTSADIVGMLKSLTEHDLLLYDVIITDELRVMLSVSQKDYLILRRIVRKRGDRCKLENPSKMSVLLDGLKKRWLILFGCLALLLLSIWIPSRIYFVEIKGNEAVPEKQIREKIAEMGLSFGMRRSDVRSELLKNAMLSQIPELDWVGITTAGCVATVEVKEKPAAHNGQGNGPYSVSSIVASTDGVIEQITVTKGTALCKKGQAVREGQVLISGYEDCGLLIKASHAEGEVIAQTLRSVEAISPAIATVRESEISLKTEYSLLIGKKIINFKNNSGISPSGCVKIYEEKYLTLPGEYVLPVALVIETTIFHETETVILDEDSFFWMEDAVGGYIETQIRAGQILRKNTDCAMQEDRYSFKAHYICREQIGKNKIEETLEHYGKDS